MNNVKCEIVQDLLPLYCDGACSEESRKLIEAHIRVCDCCGEALRHMRAPMEVVPDPTELDAIEAASRVWKKNKRRAFRRGVIITLALVLLAGILFVGYFLGSHYRMSCADGDWDALRDKLSEDSNAQTLGQVELSAQKGNYLAIACRDEAGLWYVGVFGPDSVFTDRWVEIGSMIKVRTGKLANWNCKVDGRDTVLVCFGAELPDTFTGYTFTNNGVTYQCPVKENSVLDFFFVPDAYDRRTHLEPVYGS